MGKRKRVVIVGSYNQDHIWRMSGFPARGETVLGDSFATGAGGKGFNQAVAAVRQGADTAFIGACGDDALGRSAQTQARAAGIDGHWQVLADQPTGTAAILVDAGGDNQVIVAPAANAQLDAEFVRSRRAAFDDAGVLLVQLETNFAALDAALVAARSAGALRILNPAPFHAELDAARLTQCDLLTPNESEFTQLVAHLGGPAVDTQAVAGMADANLHALCRRLPVATIVVTLGAAGCFVSHAADQARFADGSEYYRVPAPRVATVDTTGAGDAFNGALAAALARAPDAAFAELVLAASRAAALSTERRGAADAMVDRAAVLARFATARGQA